MLHQRPRHRRSVSSRRERVRTGDRGLGRPDRRSCPALPDVEQVFCFENRGREIGVTLPHPHGQIYAYPFVTPRTRRMLDSAAQPPRADLAEPVRRRAGARSAADEVRVVSESEHWTAFVPAAARWPVEVHLYPRRHLPTCPRSPTTNATTSPRIYLDVLRRLDALFDVPAPLHRRLAPGSGAHRSRPRLLAPAGLLDPACRGQAEVPGRLGVGHGCLRHRHPPRRTSPTGCVRWAR